MTRCETAEKILEYACEKENFINRADKQFFRTALECGPSGYVGCSNECRGVGLLRRSGYMADIAEYLLKLGIEKDRAIIEIKPVLCAFEKMKNTRNGHIIYYRIGKKMGVQEYADKIGISRRHCRRLYVKAMEEFLNLVTFYGGAKLVEKFADATVFDESNEQKNANKASSCNSTRKIYTARKSTEKIFNASYHHSDDYLKENPCICTQKTDVVPADCCADCCEECKKNPCKFSAISVA